MAAPIMSRIPGAGALAAALILLFALVPSSVAITEYHEASPRVEYETLEISWKAALRDAQRGSLTLDLRSGQETYNLVEVDLTSETRYYMVEDGGKAKEVHPPKTYSFRGTVEGAEDSWARLTIGPGFFGGQVFTGSPDLRAFATLGNDGSSVFVETYATTRAAQEECAKSCENGGAASSGMMQTMLYPVEDVDVILESTAAYWNFNGGSPTWSAMQNGFNVWSPAFEDIDVNLEIPSMYAWTSSGPSGNQCITNGGTTGLLTELRDVWKTDRSSVSRDAVLLHHYYDGALTWDGTGGGAGGCALTEGALSDIDDDSYAVANMDDSSNRWKKMGHEHGHLLDAMHVSGSTGYIPNTASCGGDPDHSGLMSDASDSCKLYAFSPTNENRIRDCVEDRPNCD